MCREVGEILTAASNKWSLLIVRHLTPGPARFNELRRHLGGITHKVLTSTRLEAARPLRRPGRLTSRLQPCAEASVRSSCQLDAYRREPS